MRKVHSIVFNGPIPYEGKKRSELWHPIMDIEAEGVTVHQRNGDEVFVPMTNVRAITYSAMEEAAPFVAAVHKEIEETQKEREQNLARFYYQDGIAPSPTEPVKKKRGRPPKVRP